MNYEEIQFEQLESNIEHWVKSDEHDALNTFGEELVSAVKEALDYE